MAGRIATTEELFGSPDTQSSSHIKTTEELFGDTSPKEGFDATKQALKDFSLSKTASNFIPSLGNALEGIGTAFFHPTKTIPAIANIVKGSAEKIFGLPRTPEYEALKNQFEQKWGTGEELAKGDFSKAIKNFQSDPSGALLDIATVMGIGGEGLSKLGGISNRLEALQNVGKTLSAAGETVNPISMAGKAVAVPSKVAGGIAQGLEGLGTGMGWEGMKEAINASKVTPPDELKAVASKLGINLPEGKPEFAQALKGNLKAEDIYGVAMNAAKKFADKKEADYVPKLREISQISEPLDLTPLYDELDSKLKQFKVNVKSDGRLDFSHSTFATDRQGQATINNVYKTIKNWENDMQNIRPEGVAEDVPIIDPSTGEEVRSEYTTPEYVDTLKKSLSNEYSPSDRARAFAQSLADKTKNILNQNVPGYKEMTEQYNKASDFQRDIQQALSLKENGNESAAITKLTAALRPNFEHRRALLDELNNYAGMDLKSAIAGQQMTSYAPRGISGAVVGALGTLTLPLRAQRIFTSPAFWGFVPFMSPKLVGETLRVLGFPASQTLGIMRNLVQNQALTTGAYQASQAKKAQE